MTFRKPYLTNHPSAILSTKYVIVFSHKVLLEGELPLKIDLQLFFRKRITFVAVLSSFVHHCAYALGWFRNRKKCCFLGYETSNSQFTIHVHSYDASRTRLSVLNITLPELFKFPRRKSQKDPKFYFKRAFENCSPIRKSQSWFTSIPRREFVSWQKDSPAFSTALNEPIFHQTTSCLFACASTPIWKAFCCMVFTSSKKRFVIWWMKTSVRWQKISLLFWTLSQNYFVSKI